MPWPTCNIVKDVLINCGPIAIFCLRNINLGLLAIDILETPIASVENILSATISIRACVTYTPLLSRGELLFGIYRLPCLTFSNSMLNYKSSSDFIPLTRRISGWC